MNKSEIIPITLDQRGNWEVVARINGPDEVLLWVHEPKFIEADYYNVPYSRSEYVNSNTAAVMLPWYKEIVAWMRSEDSVFQEVIEMKIRKLLKRFRGRPDVTQQVLERAKETILYEKQMQLLEGEVNINYQ